MDWANSTFWNIIYWLRYHAVNILIVQGFSLNKLMHQLRLINKISMAMSKNETDRIQLCLTYACHCVTIHYTTSRFGHGVLHWLTKILLRYPPDVTFLGHLQLHPQQHILNFSWRKVHPFETIDSLVFYTWSVNWIHTFTTFPVM